MRIYHNTLSMLIGALILLVSAINVNSAMASEIASEATIQYERYYPVLYVECPGLKPFNAGLMADKDRFYTVIEGNGEVSVIDTGICATTFTGKTIDLLLSR